MNKGPELDSCALSDRGVSNKSKTKTWRIFLLLLNIRAIITLSGGRWLEDELRSVNAQIEYVLRDALRKAGRLRRSKKQESH
jgi:hypothetical protein